MNVTKKSILLACIFGLLSIITWYYAYIYTPQKVVDMSAYPTFIATDTELTVYGEDGRKEKSMTSDTTTYYDEKQFFTFIKPLITTYKYENNTVNLWHRKGNTGDMVTDKIANVYGDAKVYPGFDDPVIDHADSTKFHYDFATNEITNDERVTVYGKSFTTDGTDFKFEMNTNKATYKGAPHATYYPQTK